MPDSPPEDDRALSAKAARTQRRLLVAARKVFERDGFINARVIDIATEASVSHGSFYNYFDSKQHIFRAVIADFTRLYVNQLGGSDDEGTPIRQIESGNRSFYRTYLANLRMFELYEEAASYDEEVREHRITGRKNAEHSARGSIERLQQQGLVPRRLDTEIAASCLVAMATHSFYSWHIREERGYDHELALRTLTCLWAWGLGVRPTAEDDPFYRSPNTARAVARRTDARSRAGFEQRAQPRAPRSDAESSPDNRCQGSSLQHSGQHRRNVNMPQSALDENARELSAKAARTRRRLLDAARTVFERDGFLKARVVDIAKEAGVAHGSFYTYFDSKQAIFRAVVADFSDRIYQRANDEDWSNLTVIQRIERGNRQFYDTYLANLRMFELYEEAASYDKEVREHRIAGRHRSEERIRKSIERFQQQGLTPRSLDARIAASCLVAMATHSYYTWHIREERGYDVTEANRTLTYLWAAALGLRAEPGDDEFYQSLGKPAAADAKPPRKAAKRAAKKSTGPRAKP